jgi:hypothetical protein
MMPKRSGAITTERGRRVHGDPEGQREWGETAGGGAARARCATVWWIE